MNAHFSLVGCTARTKLVSGQPEAKGKPWYLRRNVPVQMGWGHTLKIDRSFVLDIREEEAEGEASIINAIVAMARGLKLDLIAEGVENRTQLSYLKGQGCSEVQGYIFAEPMPADAMCTMLKDDPLAEIVLRESLAAVS